MRYLRGIVVLGLLTAFLMIACGDSPTEPTHNEEGEAEDGTETGESGRMYGIDEEARETRAGVELVMRFAGGTFTGTVTNTTSATVRDARVEIHLSNGVELGPTPRQDLAPGEQAPAMLDASGQTFTTWSVHVELGSSSA